MIGRLRRSGEWAGATRLDRLFMFGALNWVAQWYRPGGTLDAADPYSDDYAAKAYESGFATMGGGR